MNLILLEPGEVQADGVACLRDERAEHVRSVLRAAPGDCLRVGVVDGAVGEAVVLTDNGAELCLQCRWIGAPPAAPRVDLLLAMPRPKVMNRLWPTVATVGVGRIMIVRAWKSERPYFDSHMLEPAHVRRRLIEGLQQARDTRLPRVSVHRQFKKFMEDELADFGPYALRLVAHPGAGDFPHGQLRELGAEARVLVAVGPEGGWTEYELEQFAARGFERVGCGPRVLRTEVACSVLLVLANEALNEASMPD
ncbi:MAG: 16S rRNA (uracil(1498)-N(3))-methyltransferase [Lentisphaerae bacterium]|jgi:RsmE family RNA methyltransferase|nr:16S rRNA (uracil(1498)-N(3))-methyltransferase [Lentisphaerota bacterium]